MATDGEDALGLAEARCQYFDLSPRHSLESPRRCPSEGDENEDCNAPTKLCGLKGQTKGAKKAATTTPPGHSLESPRRCPSEGDENEDCNAPTKHCGLKGQTTCAKKATMTTPRSIQPSSRQSPTPRRTASKPESILTPHTSRVSSQPLRMTPEREEGESLLASTSVCSELSRESRLTQLSTRGTVRRHLSSKELEEMQVEQKRRELQEQIRRNEVSCRKALGASDVSTAGRVQGRPAKMTIPKEFNFSRSATPKTPRTDISACSDSEDLAPSRSSKLRCTPASARTATPTRQWKPQLTVARAPKLLTARCPSTSGPRRSLSCPPEDFVAGAEGGSAEQEPRRQRPERPATPKGRAPAAAPAAALRTERRAAAAAQAAPRASAARGAAAAGPCKKAAAQERAQLARRLAQQQKDEEARTAQEVMCVFRKPEEAPARPRPLVNPPPGWDGGSDMLSVGSARSVASSVLDQSLGMLEQGKGRPKSARGPPRPSFGSSATRPCLS